MEWKSQLADEVGDEHYPLMGLRGRDDLSLGRKPMGDFLGQISGLPELGDVLLLDGGDHPLALRSGSRHDRSAFLGWKRRGLGRWSLRMDGQRERRRG